MRSTSHPMTRRMLQRVAVMALAGLHLGATQAITMNELFDAVHAQSNISNPAVLQGQTMNLYSGGTMFMRTPRRTYNLATITPPSWSAGCGGIDLFAGGFSFINKEQFVAMLRNIGSNALGYGFKLAIQNLCPTCDNVMQALQATAQAINRQNMDSCEAAVGTVNAALGDNWKRGRQNAAKNLGVDGSFFEDITDAWTRVMNNETQANATIEAVGTARPETRDALPNGNVVWKALSKVPGLNTEYKQIIMAMVGTTIFDTSEAGQGLSIFVSKGIDIETLLGGNLADTIRVPVYRCLETTQCLNVEEGESEPMPSLRFLVRQRMGNLMTNIATRAPIADSAELVAFLSVTDIPVYKLIASATSLGNTGHAESLLVRYEEMIAAKYAELYLRRATRDLNAALSAFKAKAGSADVEAIQGLLGQIDRVQREAQSTMQTAYARAVSNYNISQEIQFNERALNANLSQTLRASLNFARSLR